MLGLGTWFSGKCKPFVDYVFSYDDNGLPLTSECTKYSFMDMYTSPEVASSFQALYKNEGGLLDKMMDFWAVVANRFKSNDNVIGYDILNEPWGVNYHDSSIMLNLSKFSRDTLYPIA